MPTRLLQSLFVANTGVYFQDRCLLAIRTSREDHLCNEMSQDGVIVCHSSSTLYMVSYISLLQALRHNFCNHREQKRNRPFIHQTNFPYAVKNGLGMRLIYSQELIKLSVWQIVTIYLAPGNTRAVFGSSVVNVPNTYLSPTPVGVRLSSVRESGVRLWYKTTFSR